MARRRKRGRRFSEQQAEPASRTADDVPEQVKAPEQVKPERSAKIPKSVVGVKYVRMLEKLVNGLRNDAEQHGNRRLFLDDVFIAYLLAFFNPTVRSLRTIEDLSQAPNVQKHLSTVKICRSTLSDFNKLIDPERLQPILATLRSQLSRKLAGKPLADRDLDLLLKQTIAVDGTFLPAVAEVTWAVANSNNHGTIRYRARVDARINVTTWVPEAIVIPGPNDSESDSAIEHLQPDKIYLYDRGYAGFALLRAHYDSPPLGKDPSIRSHFVVRYKPPTNNAPELCDATEQPLTQKDQAAGVISDRLGYFQSNKAQRASLHQIKLREVVIQYDEDGKSKTLRLITNLLNLPAWIIGFLYRQRWQVELFFRWLKSYGNFGHLICHRREGALAHLYVTIIGVMLMYLHTGYRPSKYMFVMLSLVASGAATLEDIIPILRERERQSALARASAARRRAKKKLEAR